MKRFMFAAFLAFLLPLGSKAAEPSSRPDSAGQEQAVTLLTSRFLRSFENLDLDAFMACFAPDATVFFPSPESPGRFDGQAAIRDNFAKVFAAIRQATLQLCQHFTDAEWQRRGTASENEITARALAYIIAGHELYHVDILKTRYLPTAA